ncbi:nocturnin [Glossina fuscipes]|uniref:Nocturnin n=1 Tax=Glossina fuscipes TaxID=7396 RepID=A0A8U0W4Z5_9MUSC|nr:nocturnin [Glossina fuscipes]
MDSTYQIKRKSDRKAYISKLMLTRMGSFNLATKIANVDSQDDGLKLPTDLNIEKLLQHIRQLRGDHQLPLLKRYFLKSNPFGMAAESVADNLRDLRIKSLSNVCGSSSRNPNQIRLLQWNLLSQTLGQSIDGFVSCPQNALTWANRKFLIVEEILQNQPDIICLQEVDHFKFLQTILGSQNYEGVFYPKPDSPCLYIENNNGPDGCAIFINRYKYILRNFSTHTLEVWHVQSNQVAIAVNLIIKATGREFCVCTTHLKARHSSLLSKLRNEQGRDLLHFIQKFSEGRPVLLCGDFNAEPIEPVYSTILNCEFLNLSSAYADLHNEVEKNAKNDSHNNNDKVQQSIRNEPPYTTWKIREDSEICHTIDYIFYSKNQLKVKNCLEFPSDNEIGKNRIPSFQYPSDHFSLVCDFEILDS